MALSVTQQFKDETVLLTGGLGFLGSVCLEQLLRLTEVKRVYLLVRGKTRGDRTTSAHQRVQQLLCSPLFHLLHQDAASGKRNVFNRVHVVEGDLCVPGLGLSAANAQRLCSEVGVVIHCAANIELDAQIHWSLQHNYVGTHELLQLASRMTRLRAFLHTSTYFVNNWQPRNVPVKEVVHRLPLGLHDDGAQLTHGQLVEALLAMPAAAADAAAAKLMASINFNSTYAFAKYLAELLVEDAALPLRVRKAIVRPSLIAGLAGQPYPGYVSGYGGPSGYNMGYAVGFFHSVSSIAFASDYAMDIIPADTVAALVITASARAAADADAANAGAGAGVAVYHAASAQSHPLSLSLILQVSSAFWTANPPPLCLPGTRYVTLNGKHKPTAWGLEAGRLIALAKIWLTGCVLRLMGKPREAAALAKAYTAFSVYNSPRYDRSILSAVDNVRALQAQLAPVERDDWRVLWSEAQMAWRTYGYTFFAAIRRLLFRVEADSVTDEPHLFVARSGADTAALAAWAAASTNCGADSCQQTPKLGMCGKGAGAKVHGRRAVHIQAAATVASADDAAVLPDVDVRACVHLQAASA